MIANLFLHPDSFRHNKIKKKKKVAEKLIALVNDMATVVYDNRKENIFKVPSSLVTVPIFNEMTIVEMAEYCLENDRKGVFYSMIANTSEDYNEISLDDLREKCKYREEEKEVNSIVVLNVQNTNMSEEELSVTHKTIIKDYITFDSYQIVYSKQTWIHLRRQILGNHPENPNFFIMECKRYFPMLCFHNNCVKSLTDNKFNYIETSSRKLVYYLSCLNDKFTEVYDKHKLIGSDANTILADFSGLYGFDEPGSLQQRPEKKHLLTFNFLRNNKTTCEVVCEPHLKISQEDKNCKVKNIDYRLFHPRIYFHFADPDIQEGKILIGSIGKHI